MVSSGTQEERAFKKITEAALISFCLLFGLVGVTASKGITILVSLLGIIGLAEWLSSRRSSLFPPRLPIMLLAALLCWALISSLWALDGLKSVTLSLRLAGLCLAGLLLIHVTIGSPTNLIKRLQIILVVGFGIGLLSLIVGYVYAGMIGDSLWGSYYFDPLTTLNNGAVIGALFLWPAAAIVWTRLHPRVAILLFVLVSGGLLFLSSGAAILSVTVGLAVFILVVVFGEKAGLIVGATFSGLLLAAPWIIDTVSVSEGLREFISSAPPSVEHRLLMWDFVSNRIDENSFLGWGMDSSRHLPQEAFRLASNMEIMPLHPHNAALQLRLELGWPGVIVAAAFVFSVFFSILKTGLSKFNVAVCAGTVSAYISVGAVSYGVWQNWWIATAWALAATTVIATTTREAV